MARKPVEKSTPQSNDEKDLVQQALKRFRRVADAEHEMRRNQLADKKFAAGEQWDAQIKAQREADGRPCLVINRLKPQMKQVTGQQRAKRVSPPVSPTENGDVKTAETFRGIIRNIEAQSEAGDAYEQAGKDAIEIGIGWWRYLTVYADDETNNQDIRIKRIRNPFSVYCDPAAKERDRSDMRFLFIAEDIELSEYKLQYGQTKVAKASGIEEFRDLGDEEREWIGEKVRVVEYWHVESEQRVITLPNGKTRKVESTRVVCDKLNALEVIDHYEWPGKHIPFVPVLGDEIDIEGKVDLRGMVRDAADTQLMVNVWKSVTTETMGLVPRAPYIVAEGQIAGFEKFWGQANRRNFPYLPYKPVTIGGVLAPPPQRQTAEPPIQAMMAMSQAAENDLRAMTGFYDVADQERRESSGRAILARQQQGEHGNSDLVDALNRAIRWGYRILIDLIPKIYDAQRLFRITGSDNQDRNVMVHAGQPPEAQPDGVDGVYDLSVGKYDVVVGDGRPQTNRQEFVETIGPILQSRPELMPMIGDLFFENVDVPNAKAISERFRKMLPPQLQDEKGQQDPAVLQAQMQQMGQQMQAMGQQMQQQQQVIDAKVVEAQSREKIAQAEIELKERIAAAELDAKIRIEQIKAETDRAKAMMDAQMTAQKLDADSARMAMQQNRQMEMQRDAQDHEAALERERGDREMQMDERQGQREMMQQQEKRTNA